MSEHDHVRSDVEAAITALTEDAGSVYESEVREQVRAILKRRVGIDVDDQPALRDENGLYIDHPANCSVKVRDHDAALVATRLCHGDDRVGVLGHVDLLPQPGDERPPVEQARAFVQAALDTLHDDDPLSREGRAALKLQDALDALDGVDE